MPSGIILLIYHAVTGLRKSGIRYIASVSWSHATLMFSTDCSRMLLIRPSTSEEIEQNHSRMHMKNILNAYYDLLNRLKKITDK